MILPECSCFNEFIIRVGEKGSQSKLIVTFLVITTHLSISYLN